MQPKISMKSKIETLEQLGERLNGTGDEAIKENLQAIIDECRAQDNKRLEESPYLRTYYIPPAL